MRNPWLDIADADYVGHMSSPAVRQRPALSRLMGDVLESVRPRTMLVLGGATGNGLERIDPAVTSHLRRQAASPPLCAHEQRLIGLALGDGDRLRTS
jgi:hypothetical protein